MMITVFIFGCFAKISYISKCFVVRFHSVSRKLFLGRILLDLFNCMLDFPVYLAQHLSDCLVIGKNRSSGNRHYVDLLFTAPVYLVISHPVNCQFVDILADHLCHAKILGFWCVFVVLLVP